MKKWVNNVNVGLLMMRLLELEKLVFGEALFEGRAAQAAVGLVIVREKCSSKGAAPFIVIRGDVL